MTRLNKFKEILESYEGREYSEDLVSKLRMRLSMEACSAYDSKDPEFQQKIAKFFDYVDKTGLIMYSDEGVIKSEQAEKWQSFFSEFEEQIKDIDQKELKFISSVLDKILPLYEKNEQTGQV